jgi:hypothetical protein
MSGGPPARAPPPVPPRNYPGSAEAGASAASAEGDDDRQSTFQAPKKVGLNELLAKVLSLRSRP